LSGREVAALAAVAIAVATFAILKRGGEPAATGGPGAANVWVVPEGCVAEPTRQAGGVSWDGAPAAAKACTLDQAWDAAAPGDTIRVRPGTYNAQNVTGDKAAETRIVGDGAVRFLPIDVTAPCSDFQGAVICASAANMTLEHVTIDSRDAHGVSTGMQVNGANVTLRDVDFAGTFTSAWVRGANFKWLGGTIGSEGARPGQRSCAEHDGDPLQIESPGPALISDVTIHPQGSDQTPCAQSKNGFHLESIRVENTPNVTLRRVYFADGGEAGSGHVFYSGAGAAAGQVIDGSYFGKLEGTFAVQVSPTVGGCDWTWAYNTFRLPVTCAGPGSTWIGNLGVSSGCVGKQERNVWQGPGSCGGDAFSAKLGIGPDGRLEDGSPAIDAAETAYCTGPLGGRGIGDVKRPSGRACDAGAFELSG
jgi:hypothetical protein